MIRAMSPCALGTKLTIRHYEARQHLEQPLNWHDARIARVVCLNAASAATEHRALCNTCGGWTAPKGWSGLHLRAQHV